MVSNESEIIKKFYNLNSSFDENILNKNIFEFEDLIFNLNNKSICFSKQYLKINKDITNGGVTH